MSINMILCDDDECKTKRPRVVYGMFQRLVSAFVQIRLLCLKNLNFLKRLSEDYHLCKISQK